MKKGVNKKGLQVLTFAIFVIALIALIYYSTSIAGLISNNSNETILNETIFNSSETNETIPLVTIKNEKGEIVNVDINIFDFLE